ncbi:MAG: right-handed parallel beta-helix repeat-containing protein, partial [Lentisphaerae bacterium]|nr:right-handed parallel beta-helix repeat-containing protein [Lentisphaerota bacterium]
MADSPEFVAGRKGQGLRCRNRASVVPDSVDLHLAPGLRIDCWVRLRAIGSSWQPIVIKDGEYQLRIDPPSEGGQFSFFAYLDGWEPRVRSDTVAKTGVWYHLSAGWSEGEVWIKVDDDEARKPRAGLPIATDEPLKLGGFDGVLDEVRIENPQSRDNSVTRWLFEGDLRDVSGNGHHLTGEGAKFVRVRNRHALRCGAEAVQTPSASELNLAPGLRIDCSVCFEEAPKDSQLILIKDGEYQLRVNPAREGGDFSFFVNVDGWEPRARSDKRVRAGVWYRIMARWDGEMLTLDVNGERNRSGHRGFPKPTGNPLRVGGPGMLIDHLRMENPRLPQLRVRDVRQKQGLLRAGRPEPLAVTIWNVGMEASQCAALLRLPDTIRCLDDHRRDLGVLPMGSHRTVQWTIQAETDVREAAEIQLTAEGCRPVTERRALTFFPAKGMPIIPLPSPARRGAAALTYYIDSVSGDNNNAGTSPEAAWQDFAKVNGRTLGPGQRLLIKRGSVINDELSVSASGTADNWAEIGAYGSGPRPMIRRNWDIDDRCVLVRNPDFLRIGHLNVCYAGKGLVVAYSEGGHEGLLIEDCIAHHIEGLYRPNAHGIPEWRHRKGAAGDGLGGSAGIAVMGAAQGVTVRDCEMFQCSWGFRVQGTDVNIDRVYCHDCTVRNTSPHPALTSVYRCVMQNSILDASGWHASAGTMGIMLVNPHGLIVRNCTFRNMPNVGNHDQGGIDFEARGNGCLIDRCTFENNAGAAIEVLGLKSPQPTNVEIANSRFIKNNWAHKLGPAEVFIWGRRADPFVCCSTGWIHDNGYVTVPGVKFFVNKAPATTSWSVENNTAYPTVEALERGVPLNRP